MSSLTCWPVVSIFLLPNSCRRRVIVTFLCRALDPIWTGFGRFSCRPIASTRWAGCSHCPRLVPWSSSSRGSPLSSSDFAWSCRIYRHYNYLKHFKNTIVYFKTLLSNNKYIIYRYVTTKLLYFYREFALFTVRAIYPTSKLGVFILSKTIYFNKTKDKR